MFSRQLGGRPAPLQPVTARYRNIGRDIVDEAPDLGYFLNNDEHEILTRFPEPLAGGKPRVRVGTRKHRFQLARETPTEIKRNYEEERTIWAEPEVRQSIGHMDILPVNLVNIPFSEEAFDEGRPLGGGGGGGGGRRV